MSSLWVFFIYSLFQKLYARTIKEKHFLRIYCTLLVHAPFKTRVIDPHARPIFVLHPVFKMMQFWLKFSIKSCQDDETMRCYWVMKKLRRLTVIRNDDLSLHFSIPFSWILFSHTDPFQIGTKQNEKTHTIPDHLSTTNDY